jgi:hypothetical protein
MDVTGAHGYIDQVFISLRPHLVVFWFKHFCISFGGAAGNDACHKYRQKD